MRRIYDRAEEVLIWLPVEFPIQLKSGDQRRGLASWREWRARRETSIVQGDKLGEYYSRFRPGNPRYLSN